MVDDSVVLVVLVSFVLLLFLRGGNRCHPQHRRDGFSLMTVTPVGMGKP